MTEHQTVTIDTAKPLILPDAQTVTELEHYTDNLFRFCVTRPASMRFKSGEFLMIGLIGEPHPETGRQKPLLRAYSIASRAWDETLQFYLIKVEDAHLPANCSKLKLEIK